MQFALIVTQQCKTSFKFPFLPFFIFLFFYLFNFLPQTPVSSLNCDGQSDSTTCCWSFLLAYHCVCISCLLLHPLKRHPISRLTFPIKGDSSENASNPTSKVQYWSNACQLYAWSCWIIICGRRWRIV
jgi:hypothetical protein